MPHFYSLWRGCWYPQSSKKLETGCLMAIWQENRKFAKFTKSRYFNQGWFPTVFDVRKTLFDVRCFVRLLVCCVRSLLLCSLLCSHVVLFACCFVRLCGLVVFDVLFACPLFCSLFCSHFIKCPLFDGRCFVRCSVRVTK